MANFSADFSHHISNDFVYCRHYFDSARICTYYIIFSANKSIKLFIHVKITFNWTSKLNKVMATAASLDV